MIRIVAGEFKGFNLFFPKDKRFRPSKDRVKESLFSILGDDIVDTRVLDLFSGSGSLGLEAISRGAKHADLVDINCEYIYKNVEKLKISDRVSVYKRSFDRYLKSCNETYDFIFLDPPWTDLDFFESSLKQIFQFDILKTSGLIICEHPKDYQINSCRSRETRSFGRSKLSFINHD